MTEDALVDEDAIMGSGCILLHDGLGLPLAVFKRIMPQYSFTNTGLSELVGFAVLA